MAFLPVLALVLGMQVAVSDLYARRVSNRWLLTAIVLGLGGLGWSWIVARDGFPVAHLLGFVIGLLALLPFYAIGWMGAGDVKYFAVLGLLLGAGALLPIWIIASLIAGAHALFVIAGRRLMVPMPQRLQENVQRLQSHPSVLRARQARQGRAGIPFAAYLSFATFGWVIQQHFQVWP